MLFKYLLTLLLGFHTLYALSLTDKSYCLIEGESNLTSIQKEPMLAWTFDRINIGFSHGKSLWMRFNITNSDNTTQNTMLYLDNPLLEHITLYQDAQIIGQSGLLHVNKRHALYPVFSISAPPKSSQTYYLHVQNNTTALQFALQLKSKEHFERNDRIQQFVIVLYLGMIIAFLLYAAALAIYTKQRSYLFYIFYIAALLFQQLTYLGFLPLYMPRAFTAVDNLLVVPKVAAMVITAAFFARSFLRTSAFERIEHIYKSVIAISFLLIPLTGFQAFYYPEAIVLVGLFFIFFNLFSAIFVYKKGHKQARFFIVGWSFLIIGYLMAILDALGLFSIMYSIPMLVMIFTSIEALFLLLAFIDRVRILQQQADAYQKRLHRELEKRNIIIENEVKEQTLSITNLYRELHHRVKNNLQIILSIIRMQHDRIAPAHDNDAFIQLENRVNSISKTHELLFQNDKSNTINMQTYIELLCSDIEMSFDNDDFVTHIDAYVSMPMHKAVYVGLIINELVSNTIKHASSADTIEVTLRCDDAQCHLHVSDNGAGYEPDAIASHSLGLSLVNTLVTEQLSGTIRFSTDKHTKYDILFTL